MALSTQCDQIFLGIVTGLASERPVMDLQSLHAAAHLAAPTISLQYLPMQFAIAFGIESETRILRADFPHEA
jgi:hypothetical protein